MGRCQHADAVRDGVQAVRTEAMIVAWHAKPNRKRGLREYISMLDNGCWDIKPVMSCGKVIGAVIARGPEVHVSVIPSFHRKWATPGLYRWAITDRIKRYGYVLTRGEPESEFIKRAGFQKFGVYDGSTVFVRW